MNPELVSAQEYEYYRSVYNYWLFIEKNIKSNLLYRKYSALVNAAILSNPAAAENAFKNRIMRTDVLVACLPYTTIADADANVNSSDIKNVYNELKPALYNYSESRDIVYIDYEILPSEADREALLAEVNESVEQDSTMGPNFAACSFCPHGILLGSAFPKPCLCPHGQPFFKK